MKESQKLRSPPVNIIIWGEHFRSNHFFFLEDCCRWTVSISPNCCIIIDNRPVFTDVRTVLKDSTDKTVDLLKRELEIRQAELREKWHLSSLEKIFIESFFLVLIFIS